MRMLVLLMVLVGCLQLAMIPAAAAEQPAQGIRYLDVTKRPDGWDFGQGLAINGSSKRRIVIVSYLDESATTLLLKVAGSFVKPPDSMPIFGLVRSPSVPASVTQTAKNPLGFDVFFDGTAIPPMENPDPRFTRPDQLDAFLRGIQRNYFSSQAR